MITFRSTGALAPSANTHLVRIENVELFFDVMSVMQQMHQVGNGRGLGAMLVWL